MMRARNFCVFFHPSISTSVKGEGFQNNENLSSYQVGVGLLNPQDSAGGSLRRQSRLFRPPSAILG